MATTTEITPTRIAVAFSVAILADLMQLPLIPLFMTGVLAFPCEVANMLIGAVTLVLTIALLGLHWTLLPVFMFEMVPVIDGIPTWTGTVGALVWLRKREAADVVRRAEGEEPIPSRRSLTLVRGDAAVRTLPEGDPDQEGA